MRQYEAHENIFHKVMTVELWCCFYCSDEREQIYKIWVDVNLIDSQ